MRALRILGRVLYFAAWTVVVAAVGLLALEGSGLLVEVLRNRIAARLGPLGEGLRIERVSLRWFEPGLVVEGVSLVGRRANARGEPGELVEVLRLESLHVALAQGLGADDPVRLIEVSGGRLRVGDVLFGGLRTIPRGEAPAEDEPPRRPLSPPPILLTDFAVDLDLPDGTPFELGRVELRADPGRDGMLQLRGRLLPSLAGAVPRPVPIRIDGERWPGGFRVHASARDLPFASQSFRVPEAFGALPIEEFSGALTLDGEARVDLRGGFDARGALRASLTGARLLPRPGDPALEDVDLRLDARFDPGSSTNLWGRDAWDALARLGGTWADSPVRAWGLFGRGAPPGALARVWGRIPRLPLDRSTIVALNAQAELGETWDALGPSGVGDASVDVLVPEPAQGGGFDPAFAAHLRHVGESGTVFHGFVQEVRGERSGFPIPCTGLTGHAFYTRAPRMEKPDRLALVDLVGDHGSGTIHASGLFNSPPQGAPGTELDLLIDVPSMAIDERLRIGLEGGAGTRHLWREFQPSGGTLSARWRLHEGRDTEGFTAAGRVRIDGTSMRWVEVPVPLSNVSGELELRWAARSARLEGYSPQTRHRPFGMTYRFGSRHEGPGVQALVNGMVRDESLDADEIAIEDLPEPNQSVQSVEVELQDLLLKGKDWDVLAAEFPEVGRQIEELRAKGGMDVHYHMARAHLAAPMVHHVEAVPRVVEVTPAFFQRRTRDLEGRVLVRMAQEDLDPRTSVEGRIAIAGRWPDGASLAALGVQTPEGTARIELLGAGIDPTNTSFKGALMTAVSEEEGSLGAGVDFSDSSFTGRVDFRVVTELESFDDREGRRSYELFLRDDHLQSASVRLDALHGKLVRRDDDFRSPLVTARLGDHPVELRDVRIFRLADVDRVPEADALLRRGAWRDPQGYALQGELFLEDFPLDEEHLSNLLDPETLDLLRESVAWQGLIDVRGARIVLTFGTVMDGRVALHGLLEPHDLEMSLGLPIEVSSARLDLRELVLEQGRIRGWAQLDDLDAVIAGRPMRGGSMTLSYVDGRLTVDDLQGDFAGGRLRSLGGEEQALAISLSPPYGFDLRIEMQDVEAAELMRGVFQSSIADEGRIDLGLLLEGEPGELLDVSGRGWVSLKDGQLWSIPVMRELFGRLGFDRGAIFDRMITRFQIRDGRVEQYDMQVRSAILKLVGSGWVGFDGGLRYDLEVRYSLIDRLGVFNRLLYWLNNSLWRVAIRGDMSRPSVTIRNSIVEFFRRFDTSPPRDLPLPGFGELGTTF